MVSGSNCEGPVGASPTWLPLVVRSAISRTACSLSFRDFRRAPLGLDGFPSVAERLREGASAIVYRLNGIAGTGL